jgi:hypothetical protein
VRHVVLEFGDNEAAEEFVRKLTALQDGTVVEVEGSEFKLSGSNDLTKQTITIGSMAAAYTKVVRVIGYPTMTCTCDEGKSHHGNMARSKKYGWLVHRGCGKPTTYWIGGAQLKNRKVDGWQNVAHTANNLLDSILKEE